MDTYHVWFDLKDTRADLEFAKAVDAFLGHLQKEGKIESWRLARRKLGLGPTDLGEFHIAIETQDLGQLDEAFTLAATRAEPVEALHAAVFSQVRNTRFGLYRDFPDPNRVDGP